MRRALVTLLLPAILLAQAAAGMSPGRSLCIMLEACCGHHVHEGLAAGPAAAEAAFRALHAHHHAHAVERDAGRAPHACTHARTHESVTAGSSESAPCDGSDCHFHVSPTDEASTQRASATDSILVALPVLEIPEVLLGAMTSAPESPAFAEPPGWSWPHSDQRLALETDRLLI